MNMYEEGDATLCKVVLTQCTLRRCWEDVQKQSQFSLRREEIDRFNRSDFTTGHFKYRRERWGRGETDRQRQTEDRYKRIKTVSISVNIVVDFTEKYFDKMYETGQRLPYITGSSLVAQCILFCNLFRSVIYIQS